ncbi:MAG: type II toxin-antitoxin system prevent-host-death family antitoxin [Sphingopyxis sp.]|nr:type II toxin-antitoxin system prevent-host-death family antitoxin [Sphingopyxis sp.]
MDMGGTEIAVGEAKARFSELLARAEHGETITIKRHGRAVAKIVAADPSDEQRRAIRAAEFVSWVRANPAQPLQAGETYKDFIDAGRK